MNNNVILFSAIFAVVPSLTAAAGPKPVSFKVSPTIQGGAYPIFTGTADINHDGIPDVVSLNSNNLNGTTSVVVLFGKGSGKFSAPISTTFAGTYFSMAIADFNVDGEFDLAAMGGNSVGVLFGNGDGTFQLPFTALLVQGNYTPPLTADFNADGVPDLLIENFGTGARDVLIGNGDGTFRVTSSIVAGDSSAAVADFNGDGKIDLVLSSLAAFTPTLAVYFGDGKGNFMLGPTYNFYDQKNENSAVVAGDFNGDGKTDFAFIQHNTNLFYGNGNGTFTIGPVFPSSNNGDWAVAGNFAGDQSPDFVFSTSGGIGLLSSDGLGNFLPQVSFGVPGGGASAQPAVADLDGDGLQDLVFASGHGTALSVLAGLATGGFYAPVLSGPASGIATGDFNRDGKLDVATSGGYVLSGNGKGHFNSTLILSSQRNSVAVTVTDVNHDGNADIVFGSDSGDQNIATVLGNGDGTFGPPILSPIIGSALSSMAHADYNRDGVQDVVGVSLGSDFTVPGAFLFPGNGDGSFALPVTLSTSPFSQVVTGDFDNDNKPDVLLFRASTTQNSKGQVKLLLGRGDGTFRSTPAIALGVTYLNSVAVADLNGDGILDVIIGGGEHELNAYSCVPNQTQVSVLFGNGDGSFQPEVDYTVTGDQFECNLFAITVGDFNADGQQDLAVAANDAVLLFLGTGSGNLQQQAAFFPVFGSVTTMLTGDFNADSKPDLLLSDDGLLWPLQNTTH